MSEHAIRCWSCGTSTTLNEIRTADGYCPECEVEIDLAEYYPKLAEANDALHAEAEALRESHNDASHYAARNEELRDQLEAARGLLDAARRIDHEAGQSGTANVSIGAFKALEYSIARFDALTATPAPEVRSSEAGCTCQACGVQYQHDLIVPDSVWEQIKPSGKPIGSGLLCPACIMSGLAGLGWSSAHVAAEQGERQEAVPEARRQVLLMTSYCADEGASCTDESPCADCLSMCNVVVISGGRLEHVGQLDNLPGFNKLVLEDTSRDMLRLVKALEHYAGCGKSGNVARVALSAHRQAQRQA